MFFKVKLLNLSFIQVMYKDPSINSGVKNSEKGGKHYYTGFFFILKTITDMQ